jgi:endonuclease-3 related protein
MELYQRLYDRYGPRNWWPAKDGGKFEIICGAILTQNTSWRNVEQALENMRSGSLWSFADLHSAGADRVAEAIRPSGYYNTKARKLKTFAAVVQDDFAGDLERMLNRTATDLRALLLGIWGIGEETADDIIVYAAEKPSFVIDKYTTRIVDRMGWQVHGKGGYGDYKRFFEERLPADTTLFNEFHALLDGHGSRVCKKTPVCESCCIADICMTGRGGG